MNDPEIFRKNQFINENEEKILKMWTNYSGEIGFVNVIVNDKYKLIDINFSLDFYEDQFIEKVTPHPIIQEKKSRIDIDYMFYRILWLSDNSETKEKRTVVSF